jgi:hypothetical protein
MFSSPVKIGKDTTPGLGSRQGKDQILNLNKRTCEMTVVMGSVSPGTIKLWWAVQLVAF